MRKIPLLFFFLSLQALALPLESADPSANGPEGNLLVMTPPLQFSVDPRLKKNVQFWVELNTRYNANQGLIHDSKYIDHIYEVVELGQAPGRESRFIREKKKRWKATLLSLHKKQGKSGLKIESLTEDEKKVFDLFKDVDEPNKYLNASHRKRLRFQLGQKDNFLDGYYQSGRYLQIMEDIFKKEGLPVELTRLPFVESSFNVRARSKVGASGIWQFMRSTARLFLRINDALDERNDPIRATEAAAKLLKLNFEALKSWPLAVTAYNHGRKGMMKAVRKVGSDDLEEVVAEYHSRSFGFASSNFFTELLSAVEIEKNAESYFGKKERAQPVPTVEFKIPDFIEYKEVVQRLKLDFNTIKELNPALTDAVFAGRLLVPSSYFMRIPRPISMTDDEAMSQYSGLYAQIPDALKSNAQRGSKYGTQGKLRKNGKSGLRDSRSEVLGF